MTQTGERHGRRIKGGTPIGRKPGGKPCAICGKPRKGGTSALVYGKSTVVCRECKEWRLENLRSTRITRQQNDGEIVAVTPPSRSAPTDEIVGEP